MNKKAPARPGKERILDAAEQLFAQRGYHGVSLRDITHAAGVDVALVSYHFGGKRELFMAVFERRAELLNRERLELPEDVRRAALPGCPPREIYWGYPFLTGALTLTFAETGRIDKLSGGLRRSSDLDSVTQRLAPYVAAGFRALCARAAPSTPAPLTPGKRRAPLARRPR